MSDDQKQEPPRVPAAQIARFMSGIILFGVLVAYEKSSIRFGFACSSQVAPVLFSAFLFWHFGNTGIDSYDAAEL